MGRFVDDVTQVARGQVSRVPRPSLRPSVPRPVADVRREHAVMLSRARELVEEANAALLSCRPEDRVEINVTDGDELALDLRCGKRVARLSAKVDGSVATSRLDGYGGRCSQAVQLADADEVDRLLLLLVAPEPVSAM